MTRRHRVQPARYTLAQKAFPEWLISDDTVYYDLNKVIFTP